MKERIKKFGKKAWWGMLCMLLLGAFPGIGNGYHAEAASSVNGVGITYQEREGGIAYTGVDVLLNGVRLGSAYDVWNYQDGQWRYQESYREKRSLDDRTTSYGTYVSILATQSSSRRFIVMSPGIARSLPEHYKIRTERYQKGQRISQEFEYDTEGNGISQDYSLRKGLLDNYAFPLGDFDPKGISYRYDIMEGISLGQTGEVLLDASGGSLASQGMAYYEDTTMDYIVRSLPVPLHSADRYRYTFSGWYTVPDGEEGGKQLMPGGHVEKGQRYYAHWTKVHQTYPVTCVDVVGYPGSGKILGSQNWQGEYGSTAMGRMAGGEKQMGKYYPGMEYKGDTCAMVTAEGATVYRIFEPALCEVTCIDQVQQGPGTGQQLGIKRTTALYDELVSGSLLGEDPQAGVYYEGYCYSFSSRSRVAESGCTVYRYFTPITYDIRFVAQPTVAGSMSGITGCYYGASYSLTGNSFVKKSKIRLDINGSDGSCDRGEQYVYHDFAGWSDREGGAVMYSDQARVSNLCTRSGIYTLHAIWEEKEAVIDARPVRLGYDFAGWSRDPEATVGKQQFQIDGDTTLYAVWKPAPVEYHVEYYKQELDGTYGKAQQYTFQAYTGSIARVEELSQVYPGFWLDKTSSVLQGKVRSDGSLVLALYFRRGEYQVDFDLNGGKFSQGVVPGLEQQRGLYEEEFTVPQAVPEREGYTFGGWGYEPEGKVVCRQGDTGKIPNHDQVLYAIWIPRKDTRFYVIPYYENIDGIGYLQGEPVSLYGRTGDTIGEGIAAYYGLELEEAVRRLFPAGYEIENWEDTEIQRILPDGTGKAAVYLKRKACQITYARDGRGLKESCIATAGAVYEQDYILPAHVGNSGKVARYRTLDQEYYYPGQGIRIRGDLVLIPQYAVRAVYGSGKVLFSNGSEGEEASVREEDCFYGDYGSSLSIPVPKAAGYIFQGWYRDQGLQQLAADGELTLGSLIENHIVYARWSEPLSYKLQYDLGDYKGVSFRNPAAGSYQYGREEILPGSEQLNIPEGYEFVCWYQKEDGEEKAMDRIPSGTWGDLTLYLKLREQKEAQGQPGSAEAPGLFQDTEGNDAAEDTDKQKLSYDPGQSSIVAQWGNGRQKVDEGTGQQLKKGMVIEKKKLAYRIQSIKKKKVCVVQGKKKRKNIVIPNTVKIQGKVYTVTAIGKRAFAHQGKLKTVAIGKNITQIGRKAFLGDRKLKLVKINAVHLKKVGKQAWKGVSPKCKVVLTPKSSHAGYQLIKKSLASQGISVKIAG